VELLKEINSLCIFQLKQIHKSHGSIYVSEVEIPVGSKDDHKAQTNDDFVAKRTGKLQLPCTGQQPII
jgi:hypothetical protein